MYYICIAMVSFHCRKCTDLVFQLDNKNNNVCYECSERLPRFKLIR